MLVLTFSIPLLDGGKEELPVFIVRQLFQAISNSMHRSLLKLEP